MHIYSLCCCRVEVTLRRHIQCSTSSHNFFLTYYSPFIHSSLSSHMTDNQSDRHVLCPSHVKSSYLSKLVLMPSHRTDEHTWRRELKTSLCFLNILQKVKIEGIRSLKKEKKKNPLSKTERSNQQCESVGVVRRRVPIWEDDIQKLMLSGYN